jgi:hypothetical protein
MTHGATRGCIQDFNSLPAGYQEEGMEKLVVVVSRSLQNENAARDATSKNCCIAH